MGTGAVYVTLSGLKSHSPVLTTVETIFYFLNMILFVLNTTTLLIQAIGECALSIAAAMRYSPMNTADPGERCSVS